ncbi:MAG: radical SAM protein [Clostridia bacterium]|nr:radical SAM protein [Clostridia bacterium]
MKSKANIAVFVPHAGCPHRCSFCDQNTISGHGEAPTPQQVTAMLTQAVAELNPNTQAEIAFFGGSFTAIPRLQMEALLSAAFPFVDGKQITGIRCSTRPDAIDHDVLQTLQRYGVTAVELGAQSMVDRVLSLNHRGHTAQDVENACRLIRQYHMELGVQMMVGLAGADQEDDETTAKRLIALQPDTVRIYPTLVLQHTCLENWYREGRYIPPDLETTVERCAKLLQQFEQANVRVIKLGLHADAAVGVVAGPFHPALRELCESRLYYDKANQLLCDGDRQVTLRVHPTCVSKMVGQRRANLERWAAEGRRVTVQGDPAVAPGEIQKGEISCS